MAILNKGDPDKAKAAYGYRALALSRALVYRAKGSAFRTCSATKRCVPGQLTKRCPREIRVNRLSCARKVITFSAVTRQYGFNGYERKQVRIARGNDRQGVQIERTVHRKGESVEEYLD